MWKTKHLKTVKWLVGFLLRMFTGSPDTFVSRNSTAKFILVTFELMSCLKGIFFFCIWFYCKPFSPVIFLPDTNLRKSLVCLKSQRPFHTELSDLDCFLEASSGLFVWKIIKSINTCINTYILPSVHTHTHTHTHTYTHTHTHTYILGLARYTDVTVLYVPRFGDHG